MRTTLPKALDICSRRLFLNLAFDNILRFYELQREEHVIDADKIDVSLRLLVRNYRRIKRLPLYQKSKILEAIFEQFISVEKKKQNDDTKCMDFIQDASYIYASFMLDYGIDLIEQQGKLDWRRFMALLGGLSDKTKLHEVISIRKAEIPDPNEDAKQAQSRHIQKLREMKKYYALEFSVEEAQQQFQKGLGQLFSMLEAKAGENNGARR
jgi:hypothetical protein